MKWKLSLYVNFCETCTVIYWGFVKFQYIPIHHCEKCLMLSKKEKFVHGTFFLDGCTMQ
jgi:hypothetical protein